MINKTKEKQNIPEGWKIQILGNILDIYNGKTPLKSNSDYWTGGKVSWFTINDIRQNGRIINETKQHITGEALAKTGIKLLPRKSVLLCCTASIGEVAYSDIELTTNQQFNGLVVKDPEEVDAKFLFYTASILSKELNSLSGTTTFGFVSVGKLASIKILLPPIKEQQKIAEILGVVDEDIAKTQGVIDTTEKLKRGLMQKLFTRGISHTKVKKTKLGEIPEEWDVMKLKEIANVERGKFSHRPRNAPEFYGGKYPFIQTGDIVSSDGKIIRYSQTLNEKGLSVSRMFKKGTIVMTIAANIGDTGILEFDSCFPDSLVGITSKEDVNNIFLEYLLRTKKKYLNSIATQSAQKNINLQKLEPMLVVKPDIKEQQKIAEILSAVDEKISVNKKLLVKLTKLKKGLMQDLLSGRVRVRI